MAILEVPLSTPFIVQSKANKHLYGEVYCKIRGKHSILYKIRWNDNIKCVWTKMDIGMYTNFIKNQRVARLLYINTVGGSNESK